MRLLRNVTFCNADLVPRLRFPNYVLFLKDLERLTTDEGVHAFMLIPESPLWGKLCLGLVRARYGQERESFERPKFAIV